jgi:hypothetical protein
MKQIILAFALLLVSIAPVASDNFVTNNDSVAAINSPDQSHDLAAQTAPACPALVEQALAEMGNNCAGLGRNSACYGYDGLLATFADIQPTGFFSRPSDRAPLTTLRTIQTSPLDMERQRWGIALMNLQANLPNTMPGAGVIFLLMGDVTLENEVAPEDVVSTDASLAVITQSTATLRSGPDEFTNILSLVEAGTALAADRVDNEGNWLRVVYDDAPAWVERGALVADAAINDLPVYMPDQNSPMQAFRFRTGIGQPTCSEADSVLAVQGPENITVELTVNGADITLGSLVTLQSDSPNQFHSTVITGRMQTGEDQIAHAGETITADLDANGRVIAWSEPRPATDEELATGARAAQVIADYLGEPVEAAATPTPRIAQPCTVSTDQDGTVGVHVGPGSERTLVTYLPANMDITVTGQAQADDGAWWWQVDKDQAAPGKLINSAWVAQNAVTASGDCDTVDVVSASPIVRVQTPQPRATTPPPSDDAPPPPPPVTGDPIINFWADKTQVYRSECVDIHWDVENIQEVYYQGVGHSGHGSVMECPLRTTTYELAVLLNDGTWTYRQVTINVM